MKSMSPDCSAFTAVCASAMVIHSTRSTLTTLPASWTSGGKVVKVDRVEWITMADAQTAVNALQSGDIDFIENPAWDILPVLSADKDLVVHTLSPLGFQTLGR